MKKIKLLLLINLGVLVVAAANCKKSNMQSVAVRNQAQPPTPVVQPNASAKPAIPTAVTSTTSMYYYNPAGKPDPFEPFDISKVKPNTALTPLQQFSLDQLSLKGIIWGVTNAKAIIADPTNKTYIVGIGTKIGKNNGVIIRIMNDRIVVLEQYTDVFTGKVKTNEVTMELKKTEKF
ncbi:MAG: pilus assembly protein PilP [Deltaproteobacteria bacterium]|nr:pilus assembly protein PilP [Deltaproteobacteria bacterium]MCL5278211.1 pilus assembly protein PilP [Deltaproteobacteria bacterium]